MLRPALRMSAAAGAASVALFGALLLTRGLPTLAIQAVAYLSVALAMLCVGGFVWIGLTLPRGAPWRARGLLAGGAYVAFWALGILALRA